MLARCLFFFMGRFNPPNPSVSVLPTLLCVPTPCIALLILPRLSPRRSPLLLGPGVHAGALGFRPMQPPKFGRFVEYPDLATAVAHQPAKRRIPDLTRLGLVYPL